MKLTEVTSFAPRSRTILTEGWQDLTESQQLHINRWEKELWPLLEEYTRLAEATLTPDQINSIFQSAEDVANASGSNTSTLGKIGNAAKLPIDVAKKVNAKINQLGKMAQDTGPVQNADAKFEKLKADILATKPDNKIVQGVQKISDWAKANPGKATLGVAILTTIAAFAGGPAGGLAAGLILRNTKELLQGEKLSTAVGKSVKTAAYGAIAGWALEGIGDWLEGIRYEAVPFDQAEGLTRIKVGFSDTFSYGGSSQTTSVGSIFVPDSMADEFTGLVDTLKDAAGSGTTNSTEAMKAYNEIWRWSQDFDVSDWIKDMNIQNDIAKKIAVANDAFYDNLTNANDLIAAVAQGSVSAGDKGEPIKVGSKEYSPEQSQGEFDFSKRGDTPVNKNFNKNQKLSAFGPVGDKAESIDMEARFAAYIAEADPAQGELPLNNPNTMGAKLKRGLGKAAGKAASAAKTAVSKGAAKAKAGAKELGSKVTLNKLLKAWKAAGSPTDTGSIMNILSGAGMSNDQISQIGKNTNVPLKPTTVDQSKTQSAPKNVAQQQPTIDIKALANEIKKAGVAAQVKQLLIKG